MRMAESMYDVCVVGAGMVGSAAAKWLCKLNQEIKVCLIGPHEPTEEEWQKRQIFSSHYDEGRLTRELTENLIWGTLAQRSIERYRQIEEESGIHFYEEVGNIYMDVKNGENLLKTKQNAKKMGIVSCRCFDGSGLGTQFPYLHAEENWQLLYNFKNAGYISARKLIAAQQKIAISHDCEVIDDVVVKVKEEEDNRKGRGVLKVVCQSGQELIAKRVLLCTGAFTNCYGLLPADKQVEFYPIEVSVVKAEVSKDEAVKMVDMPGMLSRIPGKEFYLLPPIRYPDGKYYIKIGGYNTSFNVLHSHREIAEWFHSQGQYEDDIDEAVDLLRFIVPGLQPISVTTSCCVSSHTPTKLLYCDMITPYLGALMGMSGQGAKSSDEIGRMGAKMIAKGAWDYDLPAELFRLQYKKIDHAKL